MPTTLYPVHPLPPKPPRYRVEAYDLSPQTKIGLARYHEGRSQWRQAGAYWRAVGSTINERACLAIATSSEMDDAWRDHCASLPAGDLHGLAPRAHGFRWLLANDCLHDHFEFAVDAYPIRDTAFMRLLIEGMDLSVYEDDALNAVIDAAGALRSDETADRTVLVRRTIELLHLASADDPAECQRRVEPWVDVAIGLGHTPRECGVSRSVVVLDGSETAPPRAHRTGMTSEEENTAERVVCLDCGATCKDRHGPCVGFTSPCSGAAS
jgi:hypothetical protein